MSAFAVRIASVAISLGAQTVLALADSPPKLNVAPSCDAAARGAIVAGRDREAEDEGHLPVRPGLLCRAAEDTEALGAGQTRRDLSG